MLAIHLTALKDRHITNFVSTSVYNTA